MNRVGSMFTFFFTRRAGDGLGIGEACATRRDSDDSSGSMLERGIYLAPSQFEAAFLIGGAHGRGYRADDRGGERGLCGLRRTSLSVSTKAVLFSIAVRWPATIATRAVRPRSNTESRPSRSTIPESYAPQNAYGPPPGTGDATAAETQGCMWRLPPRPRYAMPSSAATRLRPPCTRRSRRRRPLSRLA